MTFTYIGQFFLIMIVALPVYILGRFMMLRRHPKANMVREIVMALFFLYVFGLLMLTLVLGATYDAPIVMLQNAMERIRTGDRINLVPFRTIISGFHHSSVDYMLVNIVGNIIMFVPWGFGLAFLWKKNRTIPRILLWSALFTIFIETWQLFIGRSVDVDDLILNFIGSCVGGVVCRVWKARFKRKDGGKRNVGVVGK